MQEEWRPVVGYEGLYEISNLGRVKGLKRLIKYNQVHSGIVKVVSYPVPERIIKQGRRKDGYADVPLSRNGCSINHLVHRLIAEAWVDNPDPEHLTFVNHKDTDPTNNSISNLEWTTPGQNTSHAVQHFKNKQCIPVYCKQTGKVYASMGQADRDLNLIPGTTHDVIRHNKSCKYDFRIATDDEIDKWRNLADQNNDALTYSEQGVPYTNPTNTPVKCIDTNQVFESVSETARRVGVSGSAIEAAIKEKHCCKGYTFIYLGQLSLDQEHDYMIEMRTRSQGNRGVCYWKGKNIDESLPLL